LCSSPGLAARPGTGTRLVAELTGRGHRAIAVELPAGDDSAGLTEYAEAVLAAVAAAGREGELVLVAQSMAGLIAPELARRLPASLVVLLNAMVPAPGELAGQWWGNTGQEEARRALDRREGRPADAEFDPVTYFLHDLPPELLDEAGGERARAVRDAVRPPRTGRDLAGRADPGAGRAQPTGSSRWSSNAGSRGSGSRRGGRGAGRAPRGAQLPPRRWPTGWSGTSPSSPRPSRTRPDLVCSDLVPGRTGRVRVRRRRRGEPAAPDQLARPAGGTARRTARRPPRAAR